MNWENSYFTVTTLVVIIFFLLHFNKVNVHIYTITLAINALFSLFIILRDMSIGVDAQSYYDFFDSKDVLISEPLFNFLNLFNLPPTIILFFISLTTTTTIFVYFKNFSLRPYLMMGFYYCTFVFLNSQINIIRQGVAIGLFHLSLVFLSKNQLFKFFIVASTTILTHYSSLIIYLAIFIGKKLFKITPYFITVSITITIALYIVDFSNTIVTFAEYFGIGTLAWYLSWDLGKAWEIKHIFYFLIPFCFYILYKSHNEFINKNQTPLLALLSIFLIAMLFKRDEMFTDRLIYYSVPSFIALTDVYLFRNIKYSSAVIVILSIIWLIKTAYFQLPNWFINYA